MKRSVSGEPEREQSNVTQPNVTQPNVTQRREEYCVSVVRVYAYPHRELQGTVYNAYYGRELAFQSLAQLLFLMERAMDAGRFPGVSVESRRFARRTARAARVEDAPQEMRPPLATFSVRVTFRQNASWQGRLGWREGAQEQPFRSVLELIQLMDSALPADADAP